jgi:hypothetical protein
LEQELLVLQQQVSGQHERHISITKVGMEPAYTFSMQTFAERESNPFDHRKPTDE